MQVKLFQSFGCCNRNIIHLLSHQFEYQVYIDQPLFDESGNETQAAENTRVKALSFYEQHKAAPDQLTGVERRKFIVAKAIAGATDQMFRTTQPEFMMRSDAVLL